MIDVRTGPALQMKVERGDAVSQLVQTLAKAIKFDDVKFTGKGEDDIANVLRFAKSAQIARTEILTAIATIMAYPKVKELMEADETFQASVVVPLLKARAQISLRAPDVQ